MKLQCLVNVVNKIHDQLNIRSSGKFVKSTLAIGKEARNDKEYFIMHFSPANKLGTKYKVKKIKNVLVKYVSEGKTTIQFEEPPVELMIRCEVLQLKSFLNLLKLCIVGETNNSKISELSNISVTPKDYAPTKLEITKRSQIPAKGLARSLERLKINDIRLFTFRKDILNLRNLIVLDLSNNEIEKLPEELGSMQSLQELYLSNNRLGINESFDWKWLLGPKFLKSLRLLTLNGNHLTYLPPSIWKLESLITLDLSNNKFKTLPSTLGRLMSLRLLKISNNYLESLPCSILNLRLHSIDISQNRFPDFSDVEESSTQSIWNRFVGNLVNLCAQTVIRKRIYYGPDNLPLTLIKMLDDAYYCICGEPILTLEPVKKDLQLKDACEIVIFDNSVRSSVVPFDCTFCSLACTKKDLA